jgi:hypothetical protein
MVSGGGTLLPKLRIFQSTVLECLQRDPAARPPIRVIVSAWDHLFQAASSPQVEVEVAADAGHAVRQDIAGGKVVETALRLT